MWYTRTCYRSRAETDSSIMYATFAAARATLTPEQFQAAAEAAAPAPHSALHQWILFSRNHWPEPLKRVEHIVAISILDTYAQGILFGLLMAQRKISYATYSRDWEHYQREYRAWARRRSTQHIGTLLGTLRRTFGINVELDHEVINEIQAANQTRNAAIHASLYKNPAHPETVTAWTKRESPYRESLNDYNFGTLPRLVDTAISEIDRAVVRSGLLAKQLLIQSSEE